MVVRTKRIVPEGACVWVCSLIAIICLGLEADPAAGLEPVTIRGSRFYSGSVPYFPSANFLSSGTPAFKLRTHTYLSLMISNETRRRMLDVAKNKGYNAMYIYTLNEGDYSGTIVSPYKSGIIGGEFDEYPVRWWRSELKRLNKHNIRPILWLFPDDSPTIHAASLSELKRYVQKMVESFDDLPIMWVLALEVDEYWSKKQADELGTYLKSHTQNPVGIHQTPRQTDYMTSSWVDYGVYQYGFGRSWEAIYEDTLFARMKISSKPFIAGEYDMDGRLLADQRGLAAAFAGIAGTGNGAPGELDEFMAALPDNMFPSRSGNILRLQGSGVTAVADMNSLSFQLEKKSFH